MFFLTKYFILPFMFRPTLSSCFLFNVYVPGMSLNICGKSMQYADDTNILLPQ